MLSTGAQAEAASEIDQLVQRYAQAVDILGGEAQAACFTEDGYVEFPGVHIERSKMAASRPTGGPRRRHFFTPPALTFTSHQSATGVGYCLILEFDPETKTQKPPYSVDYADEYRRAAEGWLLAKRVISFSFS